jgi:DNA primase
MKYSPGGRNPVTDPDRYTISAAMASGAGAYSSTYLRNGRGTTAIGAYSPRARPSFRIAAPVTWKRVGVQLAVPTEYLLAHLFGIALAIADNLNDELSHGDNRVVGIDELEVG